MTDIDNKSDLDRRRERTAAAHAVAGKAQDTVTELENRLRTNADLGRQQKQTLRNAEAEAKRLKQSIKTQGRDRDRLRKAHSKAVTRAKKATEKVRAAEAKYGKSILSDLIDREKDRDRAAPATATAPLASAMEAAPEAVDMTPATVSPVTPVVAEETPATVNETPAAAVAPRRGPRATDGPEIEGAQGVSARATTPARSRVAGRTGTRPAGGRTGNRS